MRTIIDIATNDLRVFLVDRSNLVGLLVIPIALTVVIGFVSGGFSGPSRLRVDVLDDDQTALSTAFIDGLHAANSSLLSNEPNFESSILVCQQRTPGELSFVATRCCL